MKRLTFLALPISLFALVACSSNNDNNGTNPPAADSGSDVADSIPETGDDAAPDTTPSDAEPDTGPITKPTGWDTDFALPGVMGDPTAQVSSMVVTAKRWIYVGGTFHHAGDVIAHNIAVWNGAKWNALGDGLPGDVTSLAANASDEVFAVVRMKDGTHVAYKWDKTKWNDMTAQPNGAIKSIDVGADGSVWIAGYFDKLGTNDIKQVARYKDGAWSAVGTTPTNNGLEVVRAIGSGACVGGGAMSEDIGVACFNGTTWTSKKGNLEFGRVKALRVDSKGNLVAGGEFATTTDGGPGSIARWNSTESKWELIGGGVAGELGGPANVTDVVVLNDNVYVTGRIATAGGLNVRHVAMWNGKKWFDLEGGLAKTYGVTFGDPPLGNALAIDDGGELYVGGMLTRAGAHNAMYLSHFNGLTWASVDDPKAIRRGINGGTETVAVTNDGKTAYVGGGFWYAGGEVFAQNIAKFTSSGWQSLGSGLNDSVNAIAIRGEEVYATGWFTGSGSTSSGAPIAVANHIAMWNGTAWAGVGGGIDGVGHVLAVAPDNKLWIGGEFEAAGTLSASHIAVWDGARWNPVGDGVSDGLTTRVSSIVFHDGKVFVGGDFKKAGGVAANNIAMWNGTAWSAVGDGVNDTVQSLAVYGGKIIAAGAFKKSGDKEVRHLAAWDGTTWTELGGGLHPESEWGTVLVSSMGVHGGDLFVSGIIERAGATLKVSHLAKWNGTEWSDLNGGLNDLGADVWVAPDSLWVAGAFSGVGKQVPSIGIGRYWW